SARRRGRPEMPAATTLKLTGTIVGPASGSQTADVAYTNATAPDVRLSLDVPDAGFVKFDVPPTAKFVIITLPAGNTNAIAFGHDPMNLIGPSGTVMMPIDPTAATRTLECPGTGVNGIEVLS